MAYAQTLENFIPEVWSKQLLKNWDDSFVMRKHGSHMTTGEYPDDQFPVTYSLKDIGYALDLAAKVGVAADGAQLARRRLEEARDRGWGNYYAPVMYRLFEEEE